MFRLRKWATVFLVFIFCCNTGRACSCTNTADNFLDAVRQVMSSSYVDTQMAIVKCRYIGNVGSYGAKFSILHSYYRGSFTMQDTVVLWGDPGWCCRYSPRASYHPGDTLLAIINSLRFQNVATAAESPADFFIYSCNFNHILVHNDSVFGGSLSSYTFSGYPLSPFVDSLDSIIGSLNLPPVIVSEPVLKIYPNPAGSILYIELDDDSLVERAVSLTSCSGQLVYTGTLYRGLKGNLDVSALPRGLYFLNVENSRARSRHYKVVIR